MPNSIFLKLIRIRRAMVVLALEYRKLASWKYFIFRHNYLINLSFLTGTFPNALKFSIVKPLHKKEYKADINNYCSITLILFFSKIFGKCMYKRLITAVDSISVKMINTVFKRISLLL